MSLPTTAIEGVSIVLAGSFNPGIFQPAWFAAQDLIPEDEAKEAKIDLIRPEVAMFSLDWLHVQVVHERFMVSTAQSPSFEILRDLVVGTFSILSHTPVTKLGLNLDKHFKMETEEAWHEMGKRIAPPGPWDGALERPGLRSLTMQGMRTDGRQGAIFVKVEPSIKVEYGVFVGINDHYEVGGPEETEVSADIAIRIIQDRWEAFLERSNEITNTIFEGSG